MKYKSLRAAVLIGAVVPAVLLLPGTASAAETSVEREIDKTGWYYGFETTVDDVTANDSDGSVELTVDLTYRSMVGWRHTPTDRAYLEVDGEAVDISFDSPEIAGGGQASGTAKALVELDESDGTADLDAVIDSAVLVYGEANENQTKIPFSADGDVESIKTRSVPVSGTAGDSATVELMKADLWPSYLSGEKDQYELWLEVKVSTGTEHSSMYVGREHLSLNSPDSQSVGVDSRSPWTGKAMSRGEVVEFEAPIVFMIDAPATGEYTLTFTDPVAKTEHTTTITL